jgi:hypothetical protein
MPNQPTSFRFPFKLEGVHDETAQAIRYTFNGILDLNNAIRALNSKASPAAITQIVQNVASSGGGGGGSTPVTFGFVNLQPDLTPGAYTLAQTDLGGLILVQSGIAFALTLNSGLTVPFFTTVYNLGAGTITATPSLGNVNNGASVTLTTGQFGIFYFDGTDWWEVFPLASTIPTISVILSASDVLALKATPVQILAGPGSGLMNVATSVSYQYKFATTPFTIDGAFDQYICVYDGTQPTVANIRNSFASILADGFLDQSSSEIFVAPGLARGPQTNFDNGALMVALPSDCTAELLAGDGSLTITVEYAVVALT